MRVLPTGETGVRRGEEGGNVVEIDLYSRLQAVETGGGAADGETKKASVHLMHDDR